MVKFTKAKPSGLGWQVKKTEKRQIIPAPQKLENVNKLGGLAPEVEKPTARDANLGFYANGLCINLPILRICVHRAPCGVTCSPPAKNPGGNGSEMETFARSSDVAAIFLVGASQLNILNP